MVCLDVPWPADYGGAIDMFYKMEALHNAGIKIHLHYFSYNQRGQPDQLNAYCESVHVYQRKTGKKGLSGRLPYIVSSRVNEELTARLNKDDHPVLLEGIHCSGIIPNLNKNKKIIVRLHNDESEYYSQLANATRNIFRRIYFLRESRLLKKYQQSLPRQCLYACIAEKDVQTFKDRYKLDNVFYLPAFIPYQTIKAEEGIGSFCLYHGNLSVPENEKAALWLISNVFSKIKVPLIIAGKHPSKRLDRMAHLCQHTCLVADPSEKEINDLVRKAHINVLPAFASAGIKIKLLHALFEGRHCIVNDSMIKGTGLEDTCHIAANANAFASIILQLHHRPFEMEEISLRKRILEEVYNKERNVQRIIQYLW